MKTLSVVWFRDDLRLEDNPALHAAVQRGGRVIPVYIWAPEEEGDWPPGAASRWWLHYSLQAMDGQLRRLGARLLFRRGNSEAELLKLVREAGAQAVFWNRRYEPAIMAHDQKIEGALRREGLEVQSFNGRLLHEPWAVKKKSGKPFQVFSPFWRACLATKENPDPLPGPARLAGLPRWPASIPLEELELLPRIDWAGGLRETWAPGEVNARKCLRKFLDKAYSRYAEGRNRPAVRGTSRLSPHLHFGEISPRQVWHAMAKYANARSVPEEEWREGQFASELGWREFAYHLLYHFPETPTQPLRREFEHFRWRRQPDWLRAWQCGRTGYPLVDAGMRELWTTGWMHNRVRMIVASFLVKDLLLPWQEGARWFWDTLVDADLANNTLGWQWSAGCGADAAPFFRIFNPVTQGEKFDPEGEYVRRWVPELARVPKKWLHQPFAAPAEVLAKAGIVLGGNYPHPLVPHGIARELALEAYATLTAKQTRQKLGA